MLGDGVPAVLHADGLRWARSEVSKGADLINGRAWIAAFKERCDKAPATLGLDGGGGGGGRRRLLRQVASTGDEPQYWAGKGDLPNPLRNRVLEQMAAEGLPRAGRREVLPTGEDVIFWFNVGPTADVGPPTDRVFVTAARCPHQGVCLADGELREIEDLASPGRRRPVIRCPRHNRLFDVATGDGLGNSDALPRYPARYFREHGRFYVAVGHAPEQGSECAASCEAAAPLGKEVAAGTPSTDDGDAMDLDPMEEPATKVPRLEPAAAVPMPTPTLAQAPAPVPPAATMTAPPPRRALMRHTTVL